MIYNYFTVVIPVHNKEPHIQRSIESVLSQSYTYFELIVIDDASTDNSYDEITKFNDNRITVYKREVPGPGGYAARNMGIKKASHQWICFLDADDEWTPEHLERYNSIINKFSDAGVLSSGWKVVDNNDLYCDRYYVNHWNSPAHKLNFEEYLKAEVSRQRLICTIVACIRKDILVEVGGFPENESKRGGDIDTWLRCIERSGSIIWSNHIGAIYHRDSINMVSKNILTEPGKELDTVKELIRKYSHDRKIIKYLKIYNNQRITSLWMQNIKIHGYVGNIKRGIYLSVINIKVIVLLLISLWPWIAKKIIGTQ